MSHALGVLIWPSQRNTPWLRKPTYTLFTFGYKLSSLSPLYNQSDKSIPMWYFSYLQYRRTVSTKQKQREDIISGLTEYHAPLTPLESTIINRSASDIVDSIKSGSLKSTDVLKAYGKKAIEAQNEHNCLTEIMINDAEILARDIDTIFRAGDKKYKDVFRPLAGFPVSLKDLIGVEGYDTSMGYVNKCFNPPKADSAIVRLLKDAGAIPFVKTNVPYTMLSFESYNHIWGRTENPIKHGYTTGGSSSGEACLLAAGGSRLGVGSDVGGSVRIPAHFCGIYTLKCSSNRFPRYGNGTTRPGGSAGVPVSFSPMASTLGDLKFLSKSVIDMKPWKYDNECAKLPWQKLDMPSKLKIGVMNHDGIAPPSPACSRALYTTVEALKDKGHDVVIFQPPNPLLGFKITAGLLTADGGRHPFKDSNYWEETIIKHEFYLQRYIPRWLKKVAAWISRTILGDETYAYILEDFNERSVYEFFDLVGQRDEYRWQFWRKWEKEELDILITVPCAIPAFPHDGLPDTACGYTMIFNLLDYTCGVLPVLRVDKEKDALPKNFRLNKLNRFAQGFYKNYDAVKMEGLPVGVQVVGQRLEEEKVIAAMEIVESALEDYKIKIDTEEKK